MSADQDPTPDPWGDDTGRPVVTADRQAGAGHEGAPADRHAGPDNLPGTAVDSQHPEDYAVYDGIGPQQAWMAGGAGSGESRYSLVRLGLVILAVLAGLVLFGPYVLVFVAGLMLSIFLHEFGHFWTAKKAGMKVTEYFLFFGPRLWSFRRGETEYGIKAIPAGAYVRIVGMNNLEEVDPADEARTYRQQGALKRIAVVVAGPAMNLLIAFVLMTGVYMSQGRATDQWTVKEVLPGSAAEAAGLQAGDRVVSMNGQPVGSFSDFRAQLDHRAAEATPIQVVRNGQPVDLTVTPGWRLNDTSAALIPSKPALLAIDSISVADHPEIATYEEFRTLLAQPGAPITLRVDRQGHPYELTVERPLTTLPPTAQGAAGFLGVKSDTVVEQLNPWQAAGASVQAFGAEVVGMGSTFGRLFTPSGASNYVSQVADATKSIDQRNAEPAALRPVDGSPLPETLVTASSDRPISIVGISHLGGQGAEAGFWTMIGLLASVNFALALLNLLPVLPFDGGHAVIAAYEGIRSKIVGHPYHADYVKMLPVAYGVIAVLGVIGLTSILIDVLRPPNL